MRFVELRKSAPGLLRLADPVLGAVIADVGACRLRLNRDRFGLLARSILYQQLSGHAARAIHRKLEAELGDAPLNPDGLAALSDEQYRRAGVSAQKRRYLRSLADHVLTRRLRLDKVTRLPDDEVIAQLVDVDGIGVWTAQMFLIFSLGRPDVLPVGDLGIRQAIRRLYELSDAPKPAECERIAQPWRPYASFACWYLWRSLDNDPVTTRSSSKQRVRASAPRTPLPASRKEPR